MSTFVVNKYIYIHIYTLSICKIFCLHCELLSFVVFDTFSCSSTDDLDKIGQQLNFVVVSIGKKKKKQTMSFHL